MRNRLLLLLLVVFMATFLLTHPRQEESKKDDGVIYDTSNLEVLAPGAMAHPSTGVVPPPVPQLQQIAPPTWFTVLPTIVQFETVGLL